MIFRATKSLFILAVAAMLAACAGPVPKIDLEPNAMANIKTIAVIRPPEPKAYTVANFGHGGMAFGLIGGLAMAADQNSKQEQLAKVYKENGVAVSRELSQRISDRLNDIGFNARVEDGPWEEAEGKQILPFKKINSDADAVLVVSPTVMGFVATGLAGGHNNDYLPTIAAVITVLGKDRQKTLYRGFHVTGWQLKADGWRYTPPTKTFTNFEALISTPQNSTASLMDAASKIANSISTDLLQQQGIIKAVNGTVGTASVGSAAPSAYADIQDSGKLLQFGGKVKDAYEKFLTQPLPRAFAIAENGGSWASWGTKPKNPDSPKEPAMRAVPDCEARHQVKCFLYAVDNAVVYRPPVKQ